MALEKIERLPSGAVARYWRVVTARVSYDAREASFSLAGYQSEEIRRETNAPLLTRDVPNVRGEVFDTFFGPANKMNLATQCYAAARALEPFFEDAEAV